ARQASRCCTSSGRATAWTRPPRRPACRTSPRRTSTGWTSPMPRPTSPCAELTAVGLPAVFVPLPIGNGEQRLNALPIVQHGGGMLVPDEELTADWIRDKLLPVLVD